MRIFEDFYDPVDLTTCVPATSKVAELNEKFSQDGLYFPLSLNEDIPLGKLLLEQPFTAHSFRFGPFADNILGMHFILQSGKSVKIGGRVVKNVTGFDFTRFLCYSGNHFGSIDKVVLRLRPLAKEISHREITGTPDALNQFRQEFLNSSWVHVVDAFDFILNEQGLRLTLVFSCTPNQTKVFDQQLGELAKNQGCLWNPCAQLPTAPFQSFAKIKTVLSKTLPTAQALVDRWGGSLQGYLGNGYFHFDPPTVKQNNPELLQDMQSLHSEVSALGGHVVCKALSFNAKDKDDWKLALQEKLEALA